MIPSGVVLAYAFFKLFHAICAAGFLGLHCLGGLWLLGGYQRRPLSSPLMLVYFILLALLVLSGLWLRSNLTWGVIHMPWIVATSVYTVILAVLAFISARGASTARLRIGSWVASTLVFFQIVLVDMLRDPLGVVVLPGIINSVRG